MSARLLLARGAVVMGLTLALAGCGDDGGLIERTATSTTTSLTAATTSSASTTSTTTVATTTRAAPSADVALVVAADDGIHLWTSDETTPILEGRPVEVALPDHRGGVVFQGRRDADEPVPIEWIPEPGALPEVFFDEPDARFIWLQDVTLIGGRAVVVYRVARTLPNDCPPDDEECRWDFDVDHLMVRDLATGEETNLGIVGSFESDGVSHAFGETTMVTTVYPYGSPNVCVFVARTPDLGTTSPDEWLRVTGEELPYGSSPRCRDVGPDGGSWVERWVVAGPSPDGTTVAVAESSRPVDAEVEGGDSFVAFLDTATLNETGRVAIGGPEIRPTWIDHEGSLAVVGRSRGDDPIPLVLVHVDGTVIELDIDGRASIWVGESPR